MLKSITIPSFIISAYVIRKFEEAVKIDLLGIRFIRNNLFGWNHSID